MPFPIELTTRKLGFFLVDSVDISGEFLLKIKMNEDVSGLVDQISRFDPSALAREMTSQASRLVFWINLYNGFFQLLMKERPGLFDNKVKLFFGRHVAIAGKRMSLDEIEHDMLRKSMYKWSLGYIRKPFPSAFKSRLQVFTADPRIHFALNCGAVSCPPIRFYDMEQIEEQLDLATRSFLSQEVTYDQAARTATVTSIFRLYRGDFGGRKGIGKFLKAHGIVPVEQAKIKWAPYDWTRQLDNYV